MTPQYRTRLQAVHFFKATPSPSSSLTPQEAQHIMSAVVSSPSVLIINNRVWLPEIINTSLQYFLFIMVLKTSNAKGERGSTHSNPTRRTDVKMCTKDSTDTRAAKGNWA
jgi:hypothetical protein